ncbi:hypothetical protein L3C95_31345 [Chitinophaga filiformis]|uniref:hypothetical protein n=1 Tax=Chitinophaga filiformis TaxID=104663 RepID=UPI001F32F6AC|nr:hypothetical protein [Chitinophaga filiformis]MCF6407431.1 hypothetical protein [Chitinophaga filiformis]
MKTIRILVLIIVFALGGLSGFFVKNFPFIRWNTEVKIYEVFQVCSTLFIGIAIPFFIKKWIEDKRQLKNALIEECKETLTEIKRIRTKFEGCYSNNSISASDKDEILILFSDADLKVQNLKENFTLAFKGESKIGIVGIKENTVNAINNSYISYWKTVTGGSLMNSNYTRIDNDLLKSQKSDFSSVEKAIKQAIIFIHTI